MPGVWDVATKDKVESLALRYNPDEFAPLRQQIQKARQTHDLVLVAMHFQPNIAGYQAAEPYKAFARHIIDAGADIFIGQHPHHMQEFEFYKGRPMIMGNGELIRGKKTKPKYDVLKNAHEIVYQVHWPAAPGSNVVSMDLILIETEGAKCQVNIEKDMEKARARIREINPGKTFIDNEYGLTYVSTEPLASR